MLVIVSDKSLIYIKNNKGPKMEPCGTLGLAVSSHIPYDRVDHMILVTAE